MTELNREVQEALEAEGYRVASVRPTLGDQGALQRRAGGLSTDVLWLALYIADKAGGEMTGELIRGALAKAKDVVLRRRAQGDGQAQETKAVGIWLPDGSGGWYMADSEDVDG